MSECILVSSYTVFECILPHGCLCLAHCSMLLSRQVFCTKTYFQKQNSLKELYRSVTQRRNILAMLEPDAAQDGGLGQTSIKAEITNDLLDEVCRLAFFAQSFAPLTQTALWSPDQAACIVF